MKKRVLSIVLVLVMLISLVPAGAFAAESIKITITQQPNNQMVRPGGDVTLSVTATASKGDIKYIWIDCDKINIDNLNSLTTKLSNLVTGDTVVENVEAGILGGDSVVTIKNVQKQMNVQCLLLVKTGTTLIFGLLTGSTAMTVTDKVTITLDNVPICTEHSYPGNLLKTAAVEPTCGKPGNIEFYQCTTCHEYFILDSAGKYVLTDKNNLTLAQLTTHKFPLLYVPEEKANCDEKGTPEYWKCSDCGAIFLNEEGTKASTYLAIHNSIEKDPNNHMNVTHVEAKAPTCDGKGNHEYWFCDDCNTYFKDAELTRVYRDGDSDDPDKDGVRIKSEPKNHGEMVHHPATEPLCDKKGNIEYWECKECHECFADPRGDVERSRSFFEIDSIGHQFVWDTGLAGSFEYHYQRCTICQTRTEGEAHKGGVATCQKKAVCNICGKEYGSVDQYNHNKVTRDELKPDAEHEGYSGDIYCLDCGVLIQKGHVVPKLCVHTIHGSTVLEYHPAISPTCTEVPGAHAGSIEYWYCTVCNKYYTSDPSVHSDAVETSASAVVIPMVAHYIGISDGSKIVNPDVTVQKYDKENHWLECKYCFRTLENTKAPHLLTTDNVTCCKGNHCLECGYEDSRRDYNNHQGETEVRGAVEPNGRTPGYTGDTYCLGCGKVIETGRYFYYDCPDGCRNTVERVDGQEKTCSDDGIKTHYKCRMCGKLYLDEYASTPVSETELIDPCSGHDLHPSKDSLSNLLSVDGLKQILLSNGFLGSMLELLGGGTPNIDDMMENIRLSDIDHCHDDTYHWLGCQNCGKSLKELAPELGSYDLKFNTKLLEMSVRQQHYGGLATCQDRAKCIECGEYYGTIAPHDYYENNICKVCGNPGVACAAPVKSFTKNSSTGVVTLKWNEVKDAAYYQVWTSATKNGTYKLAYEGEALSYVISQSGYGKTCYVKVRAMGADGAYGDFSTVLACTGKCKTPTIKASVVTSTGKIKLTWSKITGAAKYEVWYATSKSGTYSKLKALTGTSLSHSSAKPGTVYYYKLKAIGNNSVASDFSAIVSATCCCAQPVVKISNNKTTGKNVLTWQDINGAGSYQIYRATSKDGTYSRIKTTSESSFTDTSAAIGKTYYYKVKAVSAKRSSANSAYSAVVSRCCDCPKPSCIIGTSAGHPYIEWKLISGVDKYAVYRSTSSSGTYTKIKTTTNKYIVDSSASPYYRYYYKVVAISNKSSSANSAYSNVVSIVAR